MILWSGPGTQLLNSKAACNLLSPIGITDPLITTSLPHRATHGTVEISISLTFPWLFFFDSAKEILCWVQSSLSFNYWEDNSLLETKILYMLYSFKVSYQMFLASPQISKQMFFSLTKVRRMSQINGVIFATLQTSAICAYSLFSSEIKVLLEIQKVSCWDQTGLFIF